MTSKRSRNWKGGRFREPSGYIMIYRPNHPKCNQHGYVREHRLIYEESRNCCLVSWIEIHHINGNRSDNVWYNLRPLTKSAHSRLENTKDLTNRICSICSSKTTYINKKGLVVWNHINNQILCNKCYSKDYKRRNVEWFRKYMKYYDKYRRKRKVDLNTGIDNEINTYAQMRLV